MSNRTRAKAPRNEVGDAGKADLSLACVAAWRLGASADIRARVSHGSG